jgi:ribosomal protein S18 acetylase RimI-like enzyme
MAGGGYKIVPEVPDVEYYCLLRMVAGLSAKSAEAAALGLPNTIYGVSVIYNDETVGMGRLIGDGGCFFQIVDIAVAPEHQGNGLGRRIMAALMRYVNEHAPPTASVTLLADGNAYRLYEAFGFEDCEPASRGMIYRKKG